MSVIPGELLTAPQTRVAGYTVRAATVDIETIGSGGGSIARVESGRLLKVGPQSAGAVPGPACYGAGDQPHPHRRPGGAGPPQPGSAADGAMPIDAGGRPQRHRRERRRALDMTPERAAAGIVEVLAAQVAMSMRSVTIEKGYDPRDFILAAYGGAGPTVACPIARELDIPEICIPQDPGNFCAAGMLLPDLVRSYSLTRIGPLDETPESAIREELEELRDRGVRKLEEQGVTPEPHRNRVLPRHALSRPVLRGHGAGRGGLQEEVTRRFHEAHGRLSATPRRRVHGDRQLPRAAPAACPR